MANIKSETTGQKRIDTIATDIKNLVAGISKELIRLSNTKILLL